MSPERYRIDDLTIDVGTVSVSREGQDIPIPELSFRLLVALAKHAPNVVPSEELIREVWQGDAVSDETLTQRVALLRRTLGDSARNPRYIRSIRGRGYSLVSNRLPNRAPKRPDTPASRRAPTAGWAKGLWSAAVLVAVLVTLWVVLSDRSPQPESLTSGVVSVEDLVARANVYRRQHTASANQLAIELYRQALESEPDQPQALIGLSLAITHSVTKFNQPDGHVTEALALAERRLQVDPSDSAAHRALGFALDSQGRMSQGLESYQRAYQLNPEDSAALGSAAYLLFAQGRLADALELNLRSGDERLAYFEIQIAQVLHLLGFEDQAADWFERALQLRPDNVLSGGSFAQMRLHQGRLQEAEELARGALDRGIERTELHLTLGHIALLHGDRAEAARRYQLAGELAGSDLGSDRGLMLRRLGGQEDGDLLEDYRHAIERIDLSRHEGNEWAETFYEAAALHSVFQAPEAALRALDEAISLGFRQADWLLLDPMLAPLRKEPGFHKRVESIRLAVAADRARVLEADWLPSSLLSRVPRGQPGSPPSD